MARRYQYEKITYTSDNNDTFIRGQRFYKDNQGDLFLPIPNFLSSRFAQGASKTVIWGQGNKPLRQSTIRYPDDNNSSGEGQISLLIPQNSTQNIPASLIELKGILDNKFTCGCYCFDYTGESRE